jgi:hypothetical protein
VKAGSFVVKVVARGIERGHCALSVMLTVSQLQNLSPALAVEGGIQRMGKDEE